MNKFGLVLGVTAVTALVGCLDPKYKQKKVVVTTTPAPAPATVVTPVEDVKPVVDAPTVIEVTTVPVTPAPVVTTPVVVAPVVTTPVVAAPETTTYIVQPGDTLSKISKRYNIKIDAIQRANPQIKGDVIRLGQKIKLPGTVEVGEQKVPAGALAKPQTVKLPAAPYTGATKEYVVKGGDSLSVIAQKNGCKVAQIKELNGLTSDVVRTGQKLKLPAEKTVAAAVPAIGKKSDAEKKPVAPVVEKKADAPKADPVDETPVVVEDPAPVAEPNPAPKPAEEYITYVVQEGDDITSISIQTDVRPTEIRQLNNLRDDEQLTPGKELKLPANSLQ